MKWEIMVWPLLYFTYWMYKYGDEPLKNNYIFPLIFWIGGTILLLFLSGTGWWWFLGGFWGMGIGVFFKALLK